MTSIRLFVLTLAATLSLLPLTASARMYGSVHYILRDPPVRSFPNGYYQCNAHMVLPSTGAATTITASTASACLAGVEALGAGWVPQPPGGQGLCQCFGESPPLSIATPVGTAPVGTGIRSEAGIRVYTEEVRKLREQYRFFDYVQAVEALIQAIEAEEEKPPGQ